MENAPDNLPPPRTFTLKRTDLEEFQGHAASVSALAAEISVRIDAVTSADLHQLGVDVVALYRIIEQRFEEAERRAMPKAPPKSNVVAFRRTRA